MVSAIMPEASGSAAQGKQKTSLPREWQKWDRYIIRDKAAGLRRAAKLCIGAALFEHCLGTQFDFVRQEVFLVRRDEPDMPERVFKRARPVTVKLILDRPDD